MSRRMNSIADCGFKRETFNSKPETRNPELLSVAFQPGEGFVEFFQVRLLAIAGEMQKQGVLQFRAVETDAQGLKSLLFEQPLLHLPVAIGSGMTPGDPGSLRGDLDFFQIQAVVLSAPDLYHQIEGNPSLSVKHDLIRLAGLHPNESSPARGGMHIRLQITPDNAPAFGQGEDEKIAGAEQKIFGRDDLLCPLRGRGREREVRHYPILSEGERRAGLCPFPCISSYY